MTIQAGTYKRVEVDREAMWGAEGQLGIRWRNAGKSRTKLRKCRTFVSYNDYCQNTPRAELEGLTLIHVVFSKSCMLRTVPSAEAELGQYAVIDSLPTPHYICQGQHSFL